MYKRFKRATCMKDKIFQEFKKKQVESCESEMDPKIVEFLNGSQEELQKFKQDCLAKNEMFANITCYPEPDAFSPCEDIMGNWWLRVAVSHNNQHQKMF